MAAVCLGAAEYISKQHRLNTVRHASITQGEKHSASKLFCTLTVFAIEAIKYVDKQFVDDIHDLVVMFIDGHLKIQPHELTQMPVGEGVLCPASKQCM